MEKISKQSKGFSEVLDFIEDTKEGKFTEGGVSIKELLKCTISREEIECIQNGSLQHSEIILYGLN